jgi:hypothetical protein
LIESTGDDQDLECIVSEAEGIALKHATHGLSHYQAVQQLSKLYQCEPTWDAIKQFRITAGLELITKKCFDAAGIECILMDDLFASGEKVPYPTGWHDKLTRSETKRIVRVETLAEEVLRTLVDRSIEGFTQVFSTLLMSLAEHPDVVGFKSVVCYRTGLDVDPYSTLTPEIFGLYYADAEMTGSYRINLKTLNDMIVVMAVEVAAESGKPIQFHTGLGDNDIRLVKANPAYMQDLIEANLSAKIVLLHSSYPFTREAGYLTTVYEHVYLDCRPSNYD